jgi:predicted permease
MSFLPISQNALTAYLRRLRNRWRQPALDAEFDEELRFHLDARAEANVRAGMSPDEARDEARRHLGSPLKAREGMREARINALGEGLLQDVRHAARLLRRRPGGAALTILTLSLGIGANAAIVSLLDAALLRPLPFPDAGRLVAVVDRVAGGDIDLTIPEVLDAREWSRNFDGLSFFDTRDAQINGGAEPARVLAARVEPGLWAVLGARPALGRLLNDADSKNGERVLALSDALWRSNFGADPGVVGRRLILNGQPFTVVGIMPASFRFDALVAEAPDIFLPYPMIPLYTSRAGEFASVRRVSTIGRVKAGLGVNEAAAELAAIGATLVRQYPQFYRREGPGDPAFSIGAEPLRERVRGGTAAVRPVLMLLAGAVVLVLLIACVNTAQFLLAQAVEREPEVAVRSALGAGRHRLIRQFLAESLLLAAIAGALGLAQAVWLTALLRRVLPPGGPLFDDVGLNTTVLLFTTAAAFATAMVCGLFPALRFSQASPALGLETRGSATSRGRVRQVMIATEVAVSVVLLVCAALLVQSIRDLQGATRGYSTDNVSLMRMRGLGVGRALGVVYQQYLDRIAEVRGVAAAAIASSPLPGLPESGFSIGGLSAGASTADGTSYSMVSPGYFSVLGIPLLEGRVFTASDTPDRQPVAIVNEELARRLPPGESILGRQVRAGAGPRAATLTIVGVVGNVRPLFQTGDLPQIFVPVAQQDEPSVALLVRTRPGETAPIDAVKRAIWSVSPAQAVFGVEPLADAVSGRMADHRATAMLLGGFALLALVMSVTGIYTVVAYLISRRTREIALRRAIGATAGNVAALLAGQTLWWTVAGVLAGVGGAIALSSVLRGVVAGVAPLAPALVIGVCGIYLVVVAVAMAVPTSAAMRIDPATALRAE